MASSSSRATGRGDARCDPGRHSRGWSAGQVVAAVVGLAALVGGVLVAPGAVPVGPALITVGGIALLLGLALPLVNQIELGAPMLAKVTINAAGRQNQLRGFLDDDRGLIVACAGDLCPSGDSAVRAVEASVSAALGYWRGTDRLALRRYVLCVLVAQARFETIAHGASAAVPRTEPLLRLPLPEREVLVLVDRAGLDPFTTAELLRIPPTEVSSLRARALAGLGLTSEQR